MSQEINIFFHAQEESFKMLMPLRQTASPCTGREAASHPGCRKQARLNCCLCLFSLVITSCRSGARCRNCTYRFGWSQDNNCVLLSSHTHTYTKIKGIMYISNTAEHTTCSICVCSFFCFFFLILETEAYFSTICYLYFSELSMKPELYSIII